MLTSESSIPKKLNKGSEASADGFVDTPTSAPSYMIAKIMRALREALQVLRPLTLWRHSLCLPISMDWEISWLSWSSDCNSLKSWMGNLAVLEMSWNQVLGKISFDVDEIDSNKELEWKVPESQYPRVWTMSGLSFSSSILEYTNLRSNT